MKATLIYPSIGSKSNRPFVPRSCMQPLALAVLAAVTPRDVEVVFHDDRLERIPAEAPTDLVGISVETFTARRSYEIAGEYRRRGVPVVLGGYHPSVAVEEALEHADAVVVGEAEDVWPLVVADAADHRLQKVYRASRPPRMEGVVPRRDIFRDKGYVAIELVHFARGCVHSCDFCAVPALYPKPVRCRPPEEVAREIAGLGRRFVFFADDNIASLPDEARKLFELLVPLKVRWAGQISLDFASDPEMLALMARSGCRGILIGFESLDRENLARMGKRFNAATAYCETFRRIREAGIMVWSSFVMGYEADDPRIFERTCDFAIRSRVCLAAFNHLTPYPGTPLYNRLVREKRMIHPRWWIDPEYRFGLVPFHPRQMTAQELASGCVRARSRFNTLRSIAYRALDLRTNCRNPANLAFFVGANLVSRWESRRKHLMRFGREPDAAFDAVADAAPGGGGAQSEVPCT